MSVRMREYATIKSVQIRIHLEIDFNRTANSRDRTRKRLQITIRLHVYMMVVGCANYWLWSLLLHPHYSSSSDARYQLV